MADPESPLDVLSRAATMVEKSHHQSTSSKHTQGVSCERSSSFKERHPKFRKSSTPEYLLAANSKRRNSRESHQPEEEKMLEEEEEGPLDMSIKNKNRVRSPPPPYPTAFSSPSSLGDIPPPPSYEDAVSKRYSDPLYRVGPVYHPDANKENEDTRPIREITIITDSCADPLLDEHFRRSLGANYKSLFKKSPSSQDDDEDESDDRGDLKNNNILRKSDVDDDERVKAIEAEDTERDHIVEIDKEGLTVEDHFAKALGETWIKLQAAATQSSSKSPPRRTDTPRLVTTS